MNELEQRRRELMGRDRELYDYIAGLEASKALDTLGNQLSGFSHRAGNLAWQHSAQRKKAAQAMNSST